MPTKTIKYLYLCQKALKNLRYIQFHLNIVYLTLMLKMHYFLYLMCVLLIFY